MSRWTQKTNPHRILHSTNRHTRYGAYGTKFNPNRRHKQQIDGMDEREKEYYSLNR